ncbi:MULTISPECIES: hypothetical protein [unclassified Fusibacter]|uniref:hypothetical protein n=1 Tax=unclassified Fusibacter TaxID=2624464 RepID=UPI001013B020|nr:MULTISPECIES: hypothetical protein [unclassified Fusibacter]MCK8059072.1 hypothetical protein [Fusibacter sp. A2]NPE22481.1 hypothetical protein [Fusibacter sp. A1]RXV60585.1 hypothetical protein DWB64_11590 [Fusibacter sp. A1]
MSVKQLIEEKKEQIYFIELNKDLNLKNAVIPKGLDLPVDQDALTGVVTLGEEGFDFRKILRDVCLVIGLDPQFTHRKTYIELVKGMVENPFSYCMHLGIEASNNREWIEAISFFKAAVVFDEEHIDSYYNIGKAYYALYHANSELKDTLVLARNAFQRALKIEDKPEILYYLAFIAHHQEKFIESEAFAKKALAGNLDEAYAQDLISKMPIIEDKALYEKGFRLIVEERFQEGLEALLSISEHSEDDWRINFFLGLAYRGLQMLPEAIMHLNKARDLNPIEDRIYNELGIVGMLMGEFHDAKLYLMDGLKHKPLNYEILCNLAILHIETQELELAKKFIDEAYDINNEDAIVIQTKQYIDKLLTQGGESNDSQ